MTTEKLVTITVLREFNGSINGTSHHFAEGKTTAIPEVDAIEFARAGYVEIVTHKSAKVTASPPARRRGKSTK